MSSHRRCQRNVAKKRRLPCQWCLIIAFSVGAPMGGSRGSPAEACGVAASIRRFSKPSTSFSGHDRVRITKWCEVLKFWLRRDFTNFIAQRPLEPLLLLYSADGTPASTKEVYKISVGSQKVRRSGRSSTDLLVQRLFARAIDGTCKVIVEEPLPVACKTAWAHVEAYRRMQVNPRCFGHRSILVHHFVWDRAVHSAAARKVQMIHNAMDLELGNGQGLPPPVVENLTWVTSGACVCHDAHNSLKWSILEHTQDPQALRGLFICIEALKNAFSLLMKNVRPWLCSVVVFGGMSRFPHRQLWQLLGLDPNIAEIAESLELRFESGQLHIATKWEQDSTVWETIELVLLHIWSFKKYSDSRWLSVGPSCRALMAAQVVGMSEFVAFILQNPHNSRYYISGFADHWTSAVAHLTAVVATASFPSDAALAALMNDDRVAMTVEGIESDIVSELQYVQTLPGEIWDLLGERSMWDGIRLRSAASASSFTAAGFMFWRLRIFHELPWRLCRGDVHDNLSVLAASDMPSDQVTQRIWRLMRMGYPKEEVASAVRLMGCASFSSIQVEQGHSFASNILKRHKEVGAEALRCRSLVSSLRVLTEVSVAEKKVIAGQRQLEGLRRKRPQHFTGRQFYFQQLRGLASSWARDGRALDPQVSVKLMRSHGASWASMPAHHRRDFEAKAASARFELEGAIEERKREVQSELQLLAQRREEEAMELRDGPVRMASARWSAEQMRQIQELYDGPIFPLAKVVELRKLVADPIGEPTQKMQRFYSTLQSPSADGPPHRPSWLGLVCRQRHVFAECIFKFQASGSDFIYARPVFIRQNPFVVGFVKLLAGEELRAFAPSLGDLQSLRRDWRHVFGVDTSSFCFSDEGGFSDEWSVEVLTDSVSRAGFFFVAESEWKSIDEIQLWFPGDKEDLMAEPLGLDEPVVAREVPLWIKLPWLVEHFPPFGASDSQQPGADEGFDTKSTASETDEEAPIVPNMSAEDVVQAMYERRFHWAGQEADLNDFKVQLRGGTWTQEHTGVCYDSFRGFAMKGEAQQMCSIFRLTGTATFSIKLYSEEGAHRLASLWCDKMQWCLGWWRTTGCQRDATFPSGLLDTYIQPEVGVELVGARRDAFERRLAAIRTIRPR